MSQPIHEGEHKVDGISFAYYQYEHMPEPEVYVQYTSHQHDPYYSSDEVEVDISKDDAIAIINLLMDAHRLTTDEITSS